MFKTLIEFRKFIDENHPGQGDIKLSHADAAQYYSLVRREDDFTELQETAVLTWEGRKILFEYNPLHNLNAQQESFCRYYTQDSDLYGNGTLSYALAYGHDLENASRIRTKGEDGLEIEGSSDFDKMENLCAASASRLLRNDKVLTRIVTLQNKMLRDEIVDAKHADLIMNGKQEVKLGAIKEYNNLRGRITKKLDVLSGGEKLSEGNQELKEMIRQDRAERAEILKNKIMGMDAPTTP